MTMLQHIESLQQVSRKKCDLQKKFYEKVTRTYDKVTRKRTTACKLSYENTEHTCSNYFDFF